MTSWVRMPAEMVAAIGEALEGLNVMVFRERRFMRMCERSASLEILLERT